MHKLKETGYGYRVTFDGFLKTDDAGELLAEMQRTIQPTNIGFAVLVDLRSSKAFPAEAQEMIKLMIGYCKEAGMERSAVILNSAISALQARRLAKETGISPWIRFLDASNDFDWEKRAMAWLINAIDPDEEAEKNL